MRLSSSVKYLRYSEHKNIVHEMKKRKTQTRQKFSCPAHTSVPQTEKIGIS